jgi:hypothetical protein
VERIDAPIPEFTRNIVFLSYDLADILARDIELRVIVNDPVLFIRSSYEKIRKLFELRKIGYLDGIEIKARNFLNVIGSSIARDDVNVGVDNGVLSLTYTSSTAAVFPYDGGLTVESKLKKVFNVRKDAFKLFQDFLRKFTKRHYMLGRTDLKITMCELTRAREHKEIFRTVKNRFVVGTLTVTVVATETVEVGVAIMTRAVGLVVTNINAVIKCNFIELIGDISEVGGDNVSINLRSNIYRVGTNYSDDDCFSRKSFLEVVASENVALIVPKNILHVAGISRNAIRGSDETFELKLSKDVRDVNRVTNEDETFASCLHIQTPYLS